MARRVQRGAAMRLALLLLLIVGCAHAAPIEEASRMPRESAVEPARPALREAWQIVCADDLEGRRAEKACDVSVLATYADGTVLVGGGHHGDVRFGDLRLARRAYKTAFLAAIDRAGRVRWHWTMGGSDHNDVDRARILEDQSVLIAGVRGNKAHPTLEDLPMPADLGFQAEQAYLARIDSAGKLVWIRDVDPFVCARHCAVGRHPFVGEMTAGAGDTTQLSLFTSAYDRRPQQRWIVTIDSAGRALETRELAGFGWATQALKLAPDGSVAYVRWTTDQRLVVGRDGWRREIEISREMPAIDDVVRLIMDGERTLVYARGSKQAQLVMVTAAGIAWERTLPPIRVHDVELVDGQIRMVSDADPLVVHTFDLKAGEPRSPIQIPDVAAGCVPPLLASTIRGVWRATPWGMIATTQPSDVFYRELPTRPGCTVPRLATWTVVTGYVSE